MVVTRRWSTIMWWVQFPQQPTHLTIFHKQYTISPITISNHP